MPRRPGKKTLPAFQGKLLDWFRRTRRDFPWRRSRDPYRVWVSEVMLQQTRASAVLPYYNRFLQKFPSPAALARARTESVLRAWSGLGYYSRARNLQRAARVVAGSHRGRFPRQLDAALALPGVGPYIAHAVLSIAYDQPLAVLDGNVARVIARREAIEGDLRQPARWRRLQAIADSWLPPGAPGDWNQAMMELGATVCTPRSPRCPACPVRDGCRAFHLGIVDRLPERRAKRAPVRVRIAAAVLIDPRGNTLLTRGPKPDRPKGSNAAEDGPEALFSRMWRFPALIANGDSGDQLRDYLATEFGLNPGRGQALGKLRHSVTFREIVIEPWLLRAEKLPLSSPAGRVVDLARVPRMAISSASRKIAAAALAVIDER